MASRAVEHGPTSRRVAENVALLRRDRRLTLADLSERLAELGRPILASGLSKVETGDRRVDADDLVALALALDVTPNRLLLPAGATDEPVELTAEATAPEAAAWRWATGEGALSWDPSGTTALDMNRRHRFARENRPYVPPPPTLADLDEHAEALRPVKAAVRAAVEAGVPSELLSALLNLVSVAQRLADTFNDESEA